MVRAVVVFKESDLREKLGGRVVTTGFQKMEDL